MVCHHDFLRAVEQNYQNALIRKEEAVREKFADAVRQDIPSLKGPGRFVADITSAINVLQSMVNKRWAGTKSSKATSTKVRLSFYWGVSLTFYIISSTYARPLAQLFFDPLSGPNSSAI